MILLSICIIILGTHEPVLKIKRAWKVLPASFGIFIVSKPYLWAKLKEIYTHLGIAVNHIQTFFTNLYQLLTSLGFWCESHHHSTWLLSRCFSLHPKLKSKRPDIFTEIYLCYSQILLRCEFWFLVFIWTRDSIKSNGLWNHAILILHTHIMPDRFNKSWLCIISNHELYIGGLHLSFIKFLES